MKVEDLNQSLAAVHEQLKAVVAQLGHLPQQQQASLDNILNQLQSLSCGTQAGAAPTPVQNISALPTTVAIAPDALTWLEALPLGCCITDTQSKILYSNSALTRLLVKSSGGMIGRSLMDFIHDSPAVWERWMAVLPQGGLHLEMALCTSTNTVISAVMHGRQIPADNPAECVVLWMFYNISTYKQRESELWQMIAQLQHQVAEQRLQVEKILNFESMLKRITDKVRDSLDEDQILQTAVEELTLVLGLSGCNSALYDLDQGTSTICYEYTASMPAYQGRVAQMDNFPEIYNQLRQGHYFQFCSLVPNPVRGKVAMLACPIFLDPKSSQGIDQTVLGDLWLINRKDYVFSESEVRLVQQVANQCAIAIRQARLYQAAHVQVQELEKLNRLKDEFLSTVSHELRTPIANVKMAIHMLKLAATEDRRQVYLNILESETTREAELIDELLDLQRLEASAQPIYISTSHIQDWLPNILHPFEVRSKNRQQQLNVTYSDDLPRLSTDFDILQRILAELLNNACKYTTQGGKITLDIGPGTPLPGPGPGLSILFTIRNQAHVPPEDLPHIFEKFYRVIQADRYKQGGTGLGLALVQQRVRQLKGTIQVDSEEGWTTFQVLIPSL